MSSCKATNANGDRYWCVPAADLPDGDVDEATHTAADALEALAAEGVADLLAGVLRDGWVGRLDLPDADAARLKDRQRAALATLEKIGRGE